MFWFDIWRMGIWPEWNEGTQFPKDSLSVSNFFRQMVPDLSNHQLDVPALDAMAKKIGNQVLVTHSAGGFPRMDGSYAQSRSEGVVALEPGGYVFPDSEIPLHYPGLTGGLKGVGVPMEQFMELTKSRLLFTSATTSPESNATTLGGSNWEVRV